MSYCVIERVGDRLNTMGRFPDFESALKYLGSIMRAYHGSDETKGAFYNIQYAEDEDEDEWR